MTPSGLGLPSGEVGECQRHVTSGVARALWQHYLSTGDEQWLGAEAWPVIREVAQFWLSRAAPYPTEDSAGRSISGVRQADEYAPLAQCNAMTKPPPPGLAVLPPV